MEKEQFINKRFISQSLPTVEGGKLYFFISPVDKNKDYVAFDIIHKNQDGQNLQAIGHITQETAAELFYQLNMFLDIFKDIKMDDELLEKTRKATLSKYNTLESVDIKCTCGGDLEVF